MPNINRLARLAGRLNTAELPPLVLMGDDDRLPDPCSAAAQLPRGSLIVVRSRNERRRAALAAALAKVAKRSGLHLSIADDASLAAKFRADGVHFPEAHAGRIAYWRAVRPDWFFTAAAHSLRAAALAASWGADAVFLSPVFPSASHPGRTPLTPVKFRAIAAAVGVPLYALGGIDAKSARRLAGTKLAGLAAVGALANPQT